MGISRQEWPKVVPLSSNGSNQASSIREAYLYRHIALHQFKYVDPLSLDIFPVGKLPQHIMFDKNTILFSQVLVFMFFHFSIPLIN